jgi:OTU domain-containing protein 6
LLAVSAAPSTTTSLCAHRQRTAVSRLQVFGPNALAFIVCVQVFAAGMPVVEIGEEFKGNGPPLQLCYLKHAFGLGEHYNSTKKLLFAAGAAAAEEDAEEEVQGKQQQEEDQ